MNLNWHFLAYASDNLRLSSQLHFSIFQINLKTMIYFMILEYRYKINSWNLSFCTSKTCTASLWPNPEKTCFSHKFLSEHRADWQEFKSYQIKTNSIYYENKLRGKQISLHMHLNLWHCHHNYRFLDFRRMWNYWCMILELLLL